MDVRLDIVWGLGLDHNIDLGEVQPTSCNIGSNNAVELSCFEVSVHLLSFVLRYIRV